jgi:hypothetical protein
MAKLVRRLLSLLACAVALTGAAASLDPATTAEIGELMTRLEASGCEFQRNGTWHTGAEAKAHLMRKLKYLEDRGAVQSTEQFIEQAASGSSSSGQPYWVRCGKSAPVTSGAWLTSQLQAMRAPAGARGAR